MSNGRSELFISHRGELVKQYIAYDASNRPEYTYTAYYLADHGDPCIVTQYSYDGTSSRIQKRKESAGTWDSSYDI